MNARIVTDPSLLAERIEIVRTAERLVEVGPAWMNLWRRADGLVFQSHAWIATWWTHEGARQKRDLRIALSWSGDELQAVLPLMVTRRRGMRMLEWAAKDHSDYCDALLAPGAEPVAVDRLWSEIERQGGYDVAFLNRMLPDAHARSLMAESADGRPRISENHRTEVSVRVAGSWTDGASWFEEQSKKTRQNYRRARKFLTEQGETTFRLVRDDEPVAPLLERLADLKRKWLAKNDLQSALFDQESSTLAALVQVLKTEGLLRIFVLECDGAVIALSINFEQAGTMMAFVTTYDPDFERGSPGMVLMMDYIQWSIDHGLKTVDFLCGAEAFKQRFATHSVVLGSGMSRRTLPGAVILLADQARRSLQVARTRLRGPVPATA